MEKATQQLLSQTKDKWINNMQPTLKQHEAIERILSDNKYKSYIIIFDLLNEEEITALYQVRYNDKSRMAMDFKQWDVNELTLKNPHAPAPLSLQMLKNNMMDFVNSTTNQLLFELFENEVVVKHYVMTVDGAVE